MLGGTGNGVLSSIERATIGVDGALGPFSMLPNVTLSTARTGHAGAIVGNILYVIGGSSSSGAVSSVERAIIAGDSSLGAFVPVSDVSLMTARSEHTSARFGSSLYVL